MKKITFLALFLVAFQFAFSQNASDIFNDKNVSVVYLGIDYSRTEFVGYEGFRNKTKIKNVYFNAWNQLLLDEMDKYDLAKALKLDNFSADISRINKQNNKADTTTFVVYQPTKLFDQTTLQSIVSELDLSNIKSDIGCFWVVESLNKKQELANIHLVLFNIKTKQIILNERLTGKAKGFGFRNYWINPFEQAINQINKSKYNKWKKLYS